MGSLGSAVARSAARLSLPSGRRRRQSHLARFRVHFRTLAQVTVVTLDVVFDSPDGLVFTTHAVMDEGLPICEVTHDVDDEAWQFVNGEEDFSDARNAMLVHVEHLLELDPSLALLADLPLGWVAKRQGPDDDWKREPCP